ncbi:MAG: hypothetical protein F6K26_02880 [Moorea sp. SIO2I5]|nr:hypothetical protein [Moorena sp. SIO2I5]
MANLIRLRKAHRGSRNHLFLNQGGIKLTVLHKYDQRYQTIMLWKRQKLWAINTNKK